MIKKIKLALATAAILVGGVAGFAAADRGAHPDGIGHESVMEKFDTNKDGKLDDAERAQAKAAFEAKHEAMKQERLAKYDANKDGKLDDAERGAMRSAKVARQFKRLDVNGDGKLTLDEFSAGRQGRGGPGHHRGHGRRRP